MKITYKWLEDNGACIESKEEWQKQKMRGIDGIRLVKRLVKTGETEKIDWANWLIVRLMTRNQKIAYACFAARQVLDIFEKKYPDDKRPRQAIEAAEKFINENTQENRAAAWAAAWAARDAALAAGDAAGAARDAAGAAARDAGDAAWAAGDAAGAAARDAGAAAWAARDAMKVIIINNGIKILEGE